jgi:hypothetical protein
MRLVVGAFVVLAASAMTQAIADPPAASTSAPESSTTAASAAKPIETLSPDEQALIAQGFKPRMHLGHKQYCRDEDTTGSRVQRGQTCGSVEQLTARRNAARETTEATQRIQLNKMGN